MVNKKELLKILKENLALEEETIKKLSVFYQHTSWREAVKPQSRDYVVKGLSRLIDDTEKHANLIREMITYVEEANKDEF